ncbi:archease [Anaerotalea alkaliphila]|uniref:Archease n=1 Tax=Anaerotalea alkaliphila TaxID=2662126 RepID=A0A7X5KNH2_9FIRM|nr:archease [Anaerotalea alkaliphila]NDL68024.1 archease [Anaerotalea alkaliphila]
MQRYRYLEHTADVRMLVEGSELPSLFSAALEGLNGILRKDSGTLPRQPEEEARVELEAVDETALLVDFLSEVLALSSIRRAVFFQVEFSTLDGRSLYATLHGKRVDGFDEEVKAVTYHEAEVKLTGEGDYRTVIVFDI